MLGPATVADGRAVVHRGAGVRAKISQVGGRHMLVGLIGAGRIGGTLARLLVENGHEVVLANRRGPMTLTAQVQSLGAAASASDVAGAAGTADLVVLAIPFGAYVSLRPEPFSGIVVVDATNYFPDRDGHLPTLAAGRSTSSEIIAGHLTRARV